LPVALKLTESQAHDGRSGAGVVEHLANGQILLADRAYDSDKLRQGLKDRGVWANIKPMPNQKNIPAFSPLLYRYRNLVDIDQSLRLSSLRS
jgi:transposase